MINTKDLTEEQNEELWNMVFSNSFRNFVCMNSLHYCDHCPDENREEPPQMIFSEVYLKFGLDPVCNNCATEEEQQEVDELTKQYKYHTDSEDMDWEDPDNPHQRHDNGVGCKSCITKEMSERLK